MEEVKDYYGVLDVSETATSEEIKKMYYSLAKQFHPDTTNLDSESAKTKFIEINEAYHILIDPVKRERYDYIREYGRTDEKMWEKFEDDVANVHNFALLLLEIQRYYFFKMSSGGVGGGVGAGAGAYVGFKTGGIGGAIIGGIIGAIAGLFGGSKVVDYLDGGEHKKLKAELTKKIITYIDETTELRKPFAEYIYARIYEKQGILLPVAYNDITKLAQEDERFNFILAYLDNYKDFGKGFLNYLKGNIDDINEIISWANQFFSVINAENEVERQVELLSEYNKLNLELQRLEGSFIRRETSINEVKSRMEELKNEYEDLIDSIS